MLYSHLRLSLQDKRLIALVAQDELLVEWPIVWHCACICYGLVHYQARASCHLPLLLGDHKLY